VAVLLVVLFHAGVPAITGGYVGVDVFFVLSGFLITDLLLRERIRTGATSLLQFYARRARRIIPVATLVLLFTVLASYEWLGFIRADAIAGDAVAASVFVANLHFAAQGTNYLNAQLPPSPLLHYWSLAVEEQFYVVWPTLFLLVALCFRRVSLRIRLATVLSVLTAISLVWSIIETSSNGTWAYFSPLTRAWELSCGALLAVAAPVLLNAPRPVGRLMAWLGLAGILGAAYWFNAFTPYPGYAAALPVLATVCVLAGGTIARGGGAERLLRLPPFQFVGNLSYSWYLWHWPLLIIVAEYEGRALSLTTKLALVLIALGLSYITYNVVENPVRYARRLIADPLATIFVGMCLVTFSLAISNVVRGPAATSSADVHADAAPVPAGTPARVAALVAQASRIRRLPSDLTPPLSDLPNDVGPAGVGCNTSTPTGDPRYCVYGDKAARRTVIVFGDSHAGMWIPAVDAAARRAKWRAILLFRPGCAVPQVHLWNEQTQTPDTECDRWRAWAIRRIIELKPAVVVLTSMYYFPLDFQRQPIKDEQWDQGLAIVLHQLHSTGARLVVLGDIPYLGQSPPDCLAAHTSDIQFCSTPRVKAVLQGHDEAEQTTAEQGGAKYVDVVPWFCGRVTCFGVVGDFAVYRNQAHISAAYAAWLADVVGDSLQLG
jgi:peptidoglycan/LPS O-acetylase OafA/YrhL